MPKSIDVSQLDPAIDAELIRKIKEAERAVQECEEIYKDKRQDAKVAKEAVGDAIADLRRLVREGLDPQAELPFEEGE